MGIDDVLSLARAGTLNMTPIVAVPDPASNVGSSAVADSWRGLYSTIAPLALPTCDSSLLVHGIGNRGASALVPDWKPISISATPINVTRVHVHPGPRLVFLGLFLFVQAGLTHMMSKQHRHLCNGAKFVPSIRRDEGSSSLFLILPFPSSSSRSWLIGRPAYTLQRSSFCCYQRKALCRQLIDEQ